MKSINLKINKNLYLLVLFIGIFLSFIIGYSIISSDLVSTGNVKVKKYSCNQDNLYDRISCMSTPDSISSSYVIPSTGISFASKNSDTNGKGLYTLSSTLGDNYPIKYFRGNIDNNNLVFGGFCWKIVRTTDTGGTKILYNGVPDSNGDCNVSSSSPIIGSSAYNIKELTLNGSGYMISEKSYPRLTKDLTGNTESISYGNDVTYNETTKHYSLVDYTESSAWAADQDSKLSNKHYTCFTNSINCEKVNYIFYNEENKLGYITLSNGEKIENAIENMLSSDNDKRNFKDSIIKKAVDDWYAANLTSYTNKIEDTIYCNDRSYSNTTGWNKSVSTKNRLYFGSTDRLYQEKKLSLVCPPIDSFTVSPTIGNGKLKYPVALLTGEEAVLAGGVLWSGKNLNVYTTIDSSIWLMSPNTLTYTETSVIAILGSGFQDGIYHGGLVGWGNFNTHGIRPVISLKNDSIISSGTGTSTEPYVIN